MAHTRAGVAAAGRRVGVEVEFAGLSEDQAAKLFAASCGVEAMQRNGGWTCKTPKFGSCVFYLDTRLRQTIRDTAGDAGLAAAGRIIPVELVSEPFDAQYLPEFADALAAMREGGAVGSRHHLMNGFGVHLNVEIASRDTAHVADVATAYALVEDVLRRKMEIDVSRRLLPFVDPYPSGLATDLAANRPIDWQAFAHLYLSHTTSRNHGLDMLPVLAWAAEDDVANRLDAVTKISRRPAYHFRLPESRIDEPAWNISDDWNRWMIVEGIASDATVMHRLREARLDWAQAPILYRPSWHEIASDIIADKGLELL